jgi:hypothetical protein
LLKAQKNGTVIIDYSGRCAVPPRFRAESFGIKGPSEVPFVFVDEGFLTLSEEAADPTKYTLLGHDTFEGTDYPLAFDVENQEQVNFLRQRYLKELERTQPTSSGGQALHGIQDKVVVIYPKRRAGDKGSEA